MEWYFETGLCFLKCISYQCHALHCLDEQIPTSFDKNTIQFKFKWKVYPSILARIKKNCCTLVYIWILISIYRWFVSTIKHIYNMQWFWRLRYNQMQIFCSLPWKRHLFNVNRAENSVYRRNLYLEGHKIRKNSRRVNFSMQSP